MKTIDLIAYIIGVYQKKEDLSKARLNKIIYLIDWKSAMVTGEQMTDIQWKFNHFGPYVKTIEDLIDQDNRFKIDKTLNYYGNKKFLVSMTQNNGFDQPSEQEKNIIDSIIEITQPMTWSAFIHSVYSTYPIRVSEKGAYLNLIHLAKQYREEKRKGDS